MKGLCAPAEQGNKEDGIWLEFKEAERMRLKALNYDADVGKARFIGVLLGIAIGFLLTAFLHSGVCA